jgi:galactokinase
VPAGDHPDWIRHAVARFAARFGGPPRWAALAPGRVNLIGEHVDYAGGLVLPIAIDRHVLALARPAKGDRSTFWAIDLDDEMVRVRLGGPRRPLPQRFASFALGVVDQMAGRGRPVPELDVAFSGTVPPGAGLSSSAALEVATATLLEQLGAPLEPLDKALLCQAAEHEFGGTPCGIMDMLVSVAARPGHALLIDCATHSIRHVPLPGEDALAILVADTGVKHELATSAYAERRATCAAVAERLGLESLRDATPAALEAADLTTEQRRRATHVVEENARTIETVAALEAGDLRAAGRVLLAGHASLRDLYQVTCAELDAIVDAAADWTDRGVYGARMTGGGFGGSCVILCQPRAAPAVQRHVERCFADRFGRSPAVFRVRPAGGAVALTV